MGGKAAKVTFPWLMMMNGIASLCMVHVFAQGECYKHRPQYWTFLQKVLCLQDSMTGFPSLEPSSISFVAWPLLMYCSPYLRCSRERFRCPIEAWVHHSSLLSLSVVPGGSGFVAITLDLQRASPSGDLFRGCILCDVLVRGMLVESPE